MALAFLNFAVGLCYLALCISQKTTGKKIFYLIISVIWFACAALIAMTPTVY